MNLPLVKRTLRLTALFLFCVLTFVARCHNLRDVFVNDQIYFVDPDCYSRMTRARMVAEHPGTIVRHHDFENYPQGVTSHTTAPLDYMIVAGKWVLDVGFAVYDRGKTSVLRGQTLDLSGALVGPVLGVLGAIFLALWAWALRLRFWGMALFFYAVCPILVHGTLLGRPDHQALLIVLLMVALGAELALASSPAGKAPVTGEADPSPLADENSDESRRSAVLAAARLTRWGLISGIAWALSLWVSLYEPSILLGAVLILWLAFDRRALLARERRKGWIAFALILALALLLEGWRIETPNAAMREYFGRWKGNIGELAHLDLASSALYQWLGWTVLAAPVLLVLRRKADQRALPVLALLVIMVGLTVWQFRWGYFLALVFALALPIFMPGWRKAWVAWPLFIVGLWPVAQEWDADLYPVAGMKYGQEVRRAEAVALRAIVSVKTGQNGGPFIAPWWLSPSIAYWTRQPGVAGSSHESLPGIVDTARFYLGAKEEESLAIARARGVRWVLADDPQRLVSTSAALLGVPPPETSMAVALSPRGPLRPGEGPDLSHVVVSTVIGSVMPPIALENSFFKVWRIDESNTKPRQQNDELVP